MNGNDGDECHGLVKKRRTKGQASTERGIEKKMKRKTKIRNLSLSH